MIMGVVENDRPFFFYHKTSQTTTGKAFYGVVTPSGYGVHFPRQVQRH
jgi:hypothetical protein